MAKHMLHWNYNVLASIDIETTGLDPLMHEIVEIAILPLDSNLEIRKDVMPFHVFIKPENPEWIDPKAMKINQYNAQMIMLHGFDRHFALDMFEQWFLKLKMGTTDSGTPKKIVPLGHNFSFDKIFIQQWMGLRTYAEYFEPYHKDTKCVGEFLNDVAGYRAEDKYPYQKTHLTYMASTHGIKYLKRHTALEDAKVTAATYKEQVKKYNFGIPDLKYTVEEMCTPAVYDEGKIDETGEATRQAIEQAKQNMEVGLS